MAEDFEHRPVLLDEVIAGLNIQPNGLYVDGTFGRGGHASAILERLGPDGKLLAMDKDPQAIATAHKLFAGDPRFEIEQGSFTNMAEILSARGLTGKVNGILLDLGVSSPQLDDADRGFSFRRDGDLDMRMNPDAGVSAAQWLKNVGERELAQVFKTFGEERYAKRIARAVIRARQDAPLTRTKQLAEIIAAAHPNWEKGKDPATRCFQAIRIFINGELDDIKNVLPQAVDCLDKEGRLAVISFHSLEDRIVKRFIREQVRGDDFPRDLPITQSQLQPKLKAVGKAIKPNEAELDVNPRARSSVLRIAEKLQWQC